MSVQADQGRQLGDVRGDHADEQPRLLPAPAAPATVPSSDRSGQRMSGQLTVLGLAPKSLPKGWPTKTAEPTWAWLARHRPPLPVLIAGAEGGVGTSLVTALLTETLAAGSPGPTLVVDQCGSPWGSLTRRLLGQRGGLAGSLALTQLQQGLAARRVLGAAPSTSAGAAVVQDAPAFTPLPRLFGLVKTTSGAMTVDAGRTDTVLTARLEPHPVLVLVGRADVVGAEAVCAALGFLHQRATLPVRPVVVLSSTTAASRRGVEAAKKLVATTGVPYLIHLPFDAGLALGQTWRLDQFAKPTALACLRLVTAVAKTQEVMGYVG